LFPQKAKKSKFLKFLKPNHVDLWPERKIELLLENLLITKIESDEIFLTASDTFGVLGIAFYGLNLKTSNIFSRS